MADELTYWDYEGVLGGSGGVNYTIDNQGLPVFSQAFVPETDALVYSGGGFGGEGTTYFPGFSLTQDTGPIPQLAMADNGTVVDGATGQPVLDTAQLSALEGALPDINAAVAKTQAGQALTAPEQNAYDTAVGKVKAVLDPVSRVLGVDVGRVLTALGVGGLGIVIARAVAGEPPKFEAPTPTAPLASVASARAALEQALTTTPGSVAPAIRGVPTQAVFAYLTADAAGRATLAQSYPGIADAAMALSNGEGIQATGTASQDLQAAIRGALAGQRNVADTALAASARELAAGMEQAPAERAVRLQALSQVPGYLQTPSVTTGAMTTGEQLSQMIARLLPQQPTSTILDQNGNPIGTSTARTIVPSQYSDEIQGGIARMVMDAIEGRLESPLARDFADEERQLRARLLSQLGPTYEGSTLGIRALQDLRESQDIRKQQYRIGTISTLAPQEAARRQFNITTPETAFNARLNTLLPAESSRANLGQTVQQAGLANTTALASTFGRTPTPQTQTTLSSIVPIQPLLGLQDAATSQRLQDMLGAQTALNAFNLENQDRQNIARSIAGLGTTAAGAILKGAF